MKILVRFSLVLLTGLTASALFVGCGQKKTEKTKEGLTKIRLQTDWYPEAEHGGNYQAVAKSFYKEAGVELDILPGGPGANPHQKVAAGHVEFAMGRSDDVIQFVSQGLPLVIVGAFMERDPQGVLVHEESGITSFEQLNGKNIMAVPSANWINFLKARYKIDFNLIPLNYGIAAFMTDKNFIQQCYITNEPFYARKNGAHPRVLLLADAGYNPYRVYYTTREFLEKHPDAVRGFVEASHRGWMDFMNGDPTPAKKLIGAANPQMVEEFIAYSIDAMKDTKLVLGDPAKGDKPGIFTRERLQEQIDLMLSLKIISTPVTVDQIATFEFLPKE